MAFFCCIQVSDICYCWVVLLCFFLVVLAVFYCFHQNSFWLPSCRSFHSFVFWVFTFLCIVPLSFFWVFTLLWISSRFLGDLLDVTALSLYQLFFVCSLLQQFLFIIPCFLWHLSCYHTEKGSALLFSDCSFYDIVIFV